MSKTTTKSGQSTKQQLLSFPLKKGDVFFVQDSTGQTLTHSIIRKGQRLFRNNYPEMVHAGIVLDAQNTIEMGGSGMGRFNFNHIKGEKVIVFRYKDQRVSDLVADLAYNMERSYLAERYPDLASKGSIKYAF